VSEYLPKGTTELYKITKPSGGRLILLFKNGTVDEAALPTLKLRTLDDLTEALESHQGRSISVSNETRLGIPDIKIFGKEKKYPILRDISFVGVRSVELSDIRVQDIKLRTDVVSLSNVKCFSLELFLQNTDVVIRNCEIGCLKITNSADYRGMKNNNIKIYGSSVLSLSMEQDVLIRDMTLSGNKFCTKVESNQLLELDPAVKTPQLDRASFGFLYDWAKKSGNSETAHIARGTELAIEKALSTQKFEKLILWLWGFFGSYGLSLLRPFLALLAGAAIMATLLYCTGASHTLADDQLVGWRTLISDEYPSEDIRNLTRSLVGALEGIISPLSVVSSRRMIVPDHFAVAVFQVAYGYFCIGMVLLFGFAVRRRFKMG
jgi:hypothetical protein